MSRRSRPWCASLLAYPRGDVPGRLTLQQKKILSIMLNGDAQTGLLMHIIRFVMPSKSKPLKKLMYFFFEVCPKHDAQGKLRQEWILVCNAIRFDLQAPNEYVRGNTLRFVYGPVYCLPGPLLTSCTELSYGMPNL
jgi:hypothetical protein